MVAIIIAGVVTGSVYSLVGVGLALTYKTSGIFNFGHGALATVAAYAFYVFFAEHHLPLGIALLITIVLLGGILGVILETLARRLVRASLAVQAGATVGILLLVEALAELLFGVNSREFPSFLPQGWIRLAGTNVGYAEIITFGISLTLALTLNLFLKRSSWGARMRAVVDNSDLVALSGTEPSTVRRVAWIIGCFLVILSGLLFAPDVGLDATVLTSLVVLGFGAAAIGGFTRLNLVWLGGILIGVGQALLTWYVNSTSILGNLAASLPFIVLFLVILLYPRRFLRTGPAARIISLVPSWSLPAPIQWGLGLVVLVFLVLVPEFVGFRIGAWSVTLATLILFLSLGLLVRMSGQLSLCHMTFAAIGAVAFSKLAHGEGVPWLLALIVAGLVVVPIGAVLAVPAIRLSGLYLALATFGFGLLVQNMFYSSTLMFGTSDSGIAMPGPSVSWLRLDTQKGIYYVILLCAIGAAAIVVGIGHSRPGRLLRGLSDSPAGLESLGVSIVATRVMVFAVSAFLAGVAGALIGVVYSEVNGLSYDPNTSLLYLVLIVIVLGREPWYAIAAAIGVGVVPTYIDSSSVSYYLQIIFGVSAIAVGYGLKLPSLTGLHRWLDGLGSRGRERTTFAPLARDRLGGSTIVARDAGAEADPAGSPRGLGSPSEGRLATGGMTGTAAVGGRLAELEVRALTVRFGGVVAVEHVGLIARSGVITGVIGPNGAGKTTIFNACSGFVRPTEGGVFYRGENITRRSRSWRARSGLGRTFQQLALFESMTVEENVRLGCEGRQAGSNPLTLLFGRRRAQLEIEARADEAIHLCKLADVRLARVSDLSSGRRRLVEFARCLAGNFDVLLLDEPSAGLDTAESLEFAQILRRVATERGTGVLLVEHYMDLVMGVCSYIYVLDFGCLIFEGTPAEVQASPVVQAAYLGMAAAGV